MKRPDADKPAGKTLFVLNVPPYVHEEQLEIGFSDVGPIERVILTDSAIDVGKKADSALEITPDKAQTKHFIKSKSIDKFKVAYVVFKTAKSLSKALDKTEVSLINSDNESVLCTGIEKWFKDSHEIVTVESELEAEVNTYMRLFDEKEQEARAEAKKVEVDDDGWVTVKKGKNAGFEQKESILKALEDKLAQGKKRKQFKNFYTFQIRESKHKHIVSLRKRFQDDKLKIEAMKKSRRFKPF